MNNVGFKVPSSTVIAFANEYSNLEILTNGLESKNYIIECVSSPYHWEDCLRADESEPAAFIIDTTSGEKSLKEQLASIDQKYMDAEIPVVAVVDENDNVYEEALNSLGVSKLFEYQLGQRALRFMLSMELEEYRRYRRLSEELQKRSSAIGKIVEGVFRFKTRKEAQNLATMLSHTCDNPMAIAIGLAELFINGVEHGCLDIGHDEKGKLIDEGLLDNEIQKRRNQAGYADKSVLVKFSRRDTKLEFEITDEGNGFEHQSYLLNENGHTKKHGRGILMAKSCFEELEYLGCGNKVRAVHYI